MTESMPKRPGSTNPRQEPTSDSHSGANKIHNINRSSQPDLFQERPKPRWKGTLPHTVQKLSNPFWRPDSNQRHWNTDAPGTTVLSIGTCSANKAQPIPKASVRVLHFSGAPGC